MLHFTKQQMEAIAIGVFTSKLQVHWIESFPHIFADMPVDDSWQLAGQAIEQAFASGLENENHIMMWADLCVVNRTSFAKNLPPVQGEIK